MDKNIRTISNLPIIFHIKLQFFKLLTGSHWFMSDFEIKYTNKKTQKHNNNKQTNQSKLVTKGEIN